MRVAFGCDHRGLEYKPLVMQLLGEQGHQCQDFGCYTAASVDYPDIAREVAGEVAGGGVEFGILVCGTGIGMSIAANKVEGVRAALCHDAFTARRARQHNDATILCLGIREAPAVVAEMVHAFLTTPFEGGRHQLRLDKIRALES